MVTPIQVYKFLRFKRKMVNGLRLIRSLRMPLSQVPKCIGYNGLGGMGPASDTDKPVRHKLHSYAKHNLFYADFICTFKLNGRVYCIKERPLRKGKSPPRLNCK